MNNQITITVSGRVGSGKSAMCGEIEILCKALGIEVQWQDGKQEKNLTHADWTEALEMYKPQVTIVEQVAPSVADAAGAKPTCVHAENPKACYRVRCQLGNKCIDDDLSFRAPPAPSVADDRKE